ncbi:14 kDa subunit of cytochrome bd ubiquinol oxidase [Pyrenochaeta sp. DS3sAY3a]|nr:14 kDa subunit of cytochrome bd ubiquinol oxidase [Pyrenochaeta sp. DS3sAY3a]
MSAPSLAPYIAKRPWLHKMLKPLASAYCNAAGYKQLGLRADDLIPEENDVVQTALKRLSPQEAYERVFRLRRALQLSMSHQLLPKEEWTTEKQDSNYLSSIIQEIEAEMNEREDLESMIVQKRQKQ